MSNIIKEATQTVEAIQADLDKARKIYDYRSEEMNDEDIWGKMSRGVKQQYLKILKDKEEEIAKLERRLERAKAGDISNTDDALPGGVADKMSIEDMAARHKVSVDHILHQIALGTPEEEEHTKDPLAVRDIILDHLYDDPNYYSNTETKTESFDMVNVDATKPVEDDIEKEIIADLTPESPTPVSPDKIDTTDTDKIFLRREIETIINSVEDILINCAGDNITIENELREILTKFNNIRDIIASEVKIEDVNSDSDIHEPKAPNETDPQGTQEYLKGNLEEEKEEDLNFTTEEIEEIIYDNYYVWGGHSGSLILEVNNTTGYQKGFYARYKIKVQYQEPGFLLIEPDEYDDHASQELCKEIRTEILYRLSLIK